MSAATTVQVHLNNETRELPAGTTCRDIVAELTGRAIGADGRPVEGAGLGIALARDGQVVPRARWAQAVLRDGERLEVVTAVQGG